MNNKLESFGFWKYLGATIFQIVTFISWINIISTASLFILSMLNLVTFYVLGRIIFKIDSKVAEKNLINLTLLSGLSAIIIIFLLVLAALSQFT